MKSQYGFLTLTLFAVLELRVQLSCAAVPGEQSKRTRELLAESNSQPTLTEVSLGGKVFPVVPSPSIYNLTVANAVTDWNMAVQWVVQDSNSSLIGNHVFALTQLSIWRALEANEAAKAPAEQRAVVSYAAHLALSNSYPFYYYLFDELLRLQTANYSDSQKDAAMKIAWPCVVILLKDRLNDGTQQWLDYKPPNSTAPGTFRILLPPPGFLASTSTLPQGVPQLAISKPFVLPYPLRQVSLVKNVPPPLAIPSKAYDQEYDLIKVFGFVNSTTRSEDDSNLAVVWGDSYTETAGLSVRWMRVALSTLPRNITLMQTARLLAVLAVAQFDANVVVYNQKYKWNFWRPVTAIQQGDPSHAPDPSWQAFVLSQNNPSYPSKLGAVSETSAEVLKSFYGQWGHRTSFSIGTEQALPFPDVRPVRFYNSIQEAAKEASDSRIFTGQEFYFSVTEGQVIGRQVGKYVFSQL